ncbi:SDSL [Bugula neritina]|uniref:L-serine ammonia-lyase n=1 Tax=Bugula neritina TaxID=10212 RepID=A0A7J7K0W1_BUGNE|nr:SDSL [Bugula neritina]
MLPELKYKLLEKIWDDANAAAMEEIKANPDYAFVHPFDHPTIWKGNSTVIHEMKQQLGNTVPGCIIASCGGGGLLTGIIQGLDEIGWSHVPVVAMETEGADCLAASVAANKLVTLPDITSIAKSLGSRTVCQQLFDYTKDHNIISHTITDTAAVDACIKFADDHRMLVEPACGASLAVIYSGDIQKLQGTGKLPKDLDNIVVVVCGGNSVSMQTMESYKMLISSTT